MKTARLIMHGVLSRAMDVIARGAVCSLVALPVGAVENAIPLPIPTERYARMRTQSPFALATPVSAPAAPPSSFAMNWYVSGIGRLGDLDFVTIKARDLSAQFSLYGREPNAQNGVTLVGIEWSETVGRSTATIRKGAETAKLEFNEAEMHSPPLGPGENKPPTPGIPLPVAAKSKPLPGSKTSGPVTRFLKIVAPPTKLRPNSPSTPRALVQGTGMHAPPTRMVPGPPNGRNRGALNQR